MIIDGLLFHATAPGGSGVAASVAAPGSATLQPDADPVLAYVLGTPQFTSSFLQVATPNGHDTTRGWRVHHGTTAQRPGLLALHPLTPKLERGETLSVTIGGSGTAGDVEAYALAIAYPKMAGEFVSAADLRRVKHVTSISGSLTPTTNGQWPAGTAISSVQDTLRANARYAVLGMSVGNASGLVCGMLSGPDVGNYRVPIPLWDSQDLPGLAAARMAAIADLADMPLVPTIHAGNKSATFVGLVGNENATARSVSLLLAML